MRAIIYGFLLSLLLIACSEKDKGTLVYTETAAGAGFHFPYYLYIPESIDTTQPLHLIVEPNNSGFVEDDFEKHVEKSGRIATLDFYMGNYAARKLNLPLLVPVFPRTRADWKIYTHSLDRDAILQKGTCLERLDNQLVAMVDDARDKLQELGYHSKETIFMTGFSASGTFANRFTLIHPDKVLAVAAGGLNGLLMLPKSELEGRELIYPVGTADFQLLFGVPFDSVAFKHTPQFWFMGELDDNDAIPYDDGYDEPERTIIYETLGDEMQPTRWQNCVSVYQQQGIHATMKVYEGIGHEHPEKVKEEVVAFFRDCLNR